MIGRNYIEIGSKEFLDGITSSPHTDDGGFSPETVAANVTSTTSKLGVLYQAMTPLGLSTNLSGNIIAAASDGYSTGSVVKYIITDSGKYFTLDSNLLLTLRQTATINSYSFGTTDAVQYKQNLYTTTNSDVVKLTGSTLSSMDESWWSSTLGKSSLNTSCRHPLLVYEDYLFIGDDSGLHRTNGTTGDKNYLALPEVQSIVALGVDSSSGKMLISVTEGANASSSLPKVNKVLVYDGTSNKPSKVVIVEDMVTAFWTLGGTTFVAYGTNLGYWTGSGVSFLRKLNISYDTNQLIYKHKMSVADATLYVAEGENILTLEEVKNGTKRFFYVQNQPDTLNGYIQTVFSLGQGRMAYSYTSAAGLPKFSWWNKAFNTNTGSLTFYSKKYKLPKPGFIREIFIEYVDGVLEDTTPGYLSILDQAGNEYSFSSLLNDSSETKYEWTAKGANGKKFRNIQLKYTNNSSVIAGVSRFIIYYDIAE